MMTDIPTCWTPPKSIRPVAIGLLRHDAALLVMRVVDAQRRLVGLRPPGGGVEFGERAEEALHREFREEFDVSINVLGAPSIFENLYAFNGKPGHEIIFAFPISSPELIGKVVGRHMIREEDGSHAIAEWASLASLLDGETPLFPPGLLSTLTLLR